MTDVYRTVSTRQTPQSQPAGGATVKNAAGGYVFGIDDAARLRRFLTLGSDGSTYYTKAPELTRDNAAVVLRMAQSDPTVLVDTIVEISLAGRAPRQNPAIFALAIAASAEAEQTRAYALSKLSDVCRTGTHLYLFTTYIEQFRGWGPALKRAVGKWYTEKTPERLSYQLLKYRQREGWMHRDLLRLARPNPKTPEREMTLRYLMIKAKGSQQPSERAVQKFGDAARSPWSGKRVDFDLTPGLVAAFEEVQTANVARAVELIALHDLSWEMLPDDLVTVPEVWEALVTKGLPQTALMRQLPRLTRLGLTTGATGSVILTQLQNKDKLRQGRVHPINVLVAQRTYASGASAKGDSTWTPTPRITDALDAAFYNAYAAVVPSGKRILLACDVSGSMSTSVSNLPLTCREAVGALSLVALNTEKDAEIVGFSDGRSHDRYGYGGGWNQASVCSRLDITPRRRLDDVCKYMDALNFGRTDCSLPMTWAQQNGLDFDSITILTDNETYYGNVHPHQSLKAYREFVGHDVKFIVTSMTATGQSIADPKDASSIDIAGFDSNVPAVISDFSAGRI